MLRGKHVATAFVTHNRGAAEQQQQLQEISLRPDVMSCPEVSLQLLHAAIAG